MQVEQNKISLFNVSICRKCAVIWFSKLFEGGDIYYVNKLRLLSGSAGVNAHSTKITDPYHA